MDIELELVPEAVAPSQQQRQQHSSALDSTTTATAPSDDAAASSSSSSDSSSSSTTLDVVRLSQSLEAQLAGEEEMTSTEDMSELEQAYFRDIDNAQEQLNFACYLIRHPDRALKLRGVHLLYSMFRPSHVDHTMSSTLPETMPLMCVCACVCGIAELEAANVIDQRVLTFYMGVANYRLRFWSEAMR
jgi:hypothetical protein